jgi:hypothetical protein
VGVEHEYDMDTAQEMEGEDSDVINEGPSNDIQMAVYKVSETYCIMPSANDNLQSHSAP